MEDREDTADETIDVVEQPKAVVVDPTKGLKKANRTLTTERDQAKQELEKIKREREQEKLTAEERTKSEIEALRKERDQIKEEKAAALREREHERRISTMVAKHGLLDPEFGDVVLKGFNPEEHDDFDQFVAAAKKQAKYKVLFNIGGKATERVVDDEGEDIVPEAPRAGATRGNKVNANAEHEEFARSRWPNDVEKQKSYVAKIAAMGRGAK